ncbi:hypothetical protein ACFLTJ_02400 [Chloroflexota bacterium]
MKKLIRIALVSSLAVVGILATTGIAYAASPQIIEDDAFVCPVLGGQAGTHGSSPKIVQPAGTYYSVIGPGVAVPQQATNGKNGINTPGGTYASPGEAGYTAIWQGPVPNP